MHEYRASTAEVARALVSMLQWAAMVVVVISAYVVQSHRQVGEIILVEVLLALGVACLFFHLLRRPHIVRLRDDGVLELHAILRSVTLPACQITFVAGGIGEDGTWSDLTFNYPGGSITTHRLRDEKLLVNEVRALAPNALVQGAWS